MSKPVPASSPPTPTATDTPVSTGPAGARPRRGDVAEALIESLDYEARGVAHIDGKVTFIAGALPGERVRFRYHNKHRKYDQGAALEVLTPSPQRVEPRCQYFGVCGGCSLQHLDEAGQLAAKQSVLRETLAHIGRVAPDTWLPPLTGPAWGYRRRARLGVKRVPKKGGVLVGFREKRSSFITPLACCEVLAPAASALLPALKTLIEGLSIPDRLPQIEVAVGDNTLALAFRHLLPLTEADRASLRAFGARHQVQVYAQAGAPDALEPLHPAVPEPLVYMLPEEGLSFEFAPADFIQVNGELNRRMIAQAMALLDVRPDERVLDLFCGLGNFTLPLARRAGGVLGIEGDAALIAKARRNAARNGLANAEFRSADLFVADGPPPWGEADFDKWLLDPPRTGAVEALRRLPDDGSGPTHILYVSCNPATLARDAELLVQGKGYELAAAGALDMFPQTSHVEAMALFRHRGG